MELLCNLTGTSVFDNDESSYIGDGRGEPYVVQISGGRWIPVSVVIFASSAEDAKSRVVSFFKREKERHENFIKDFEEKNLYGPNLDCHRSTLSRIDSIWELIEQNLVHVEAMDKRMITKASWGGLLI